MATGQLASRALRAGVMAKLQFLGQRVDILRRGQKLTMLDRAGAWCACGPTTASRVGCTAAASCRE